MMMTSPTSILDNWVVDLGMISIILCHMILCNSEPCFHAIYLIVFLRSVDCRFHSMINFGNEHHGALVPFRYSRLNPVVREAGVKCLEEIQAVLRSQSERSPVSKLSF